MEMGEVEGEQRIKIGRYKFKLVQSYYNVLAISAKNAFIFGNSFIKTKFTHYTIHSFKVYNSMALVYSQSQATITTINFETYHYFRKNLHTLQLLSSKLSNPSFPGQSLICLISVSIDFCILDTSNTWNHTLCGLL